MLFGGGQNGTAILADVDIYDTDTNTWSQAQLSVARFLLAAGAVGNKVVFVGGTHMRVWVGVVLDL